MLITYMMYVNKTTEYNNLARYNKENQCILNKIIQETISAIIMFKL